MPVVLDRDVSRFSPANRRACTGCEGKYSNTGSAWERIRGLHTKRRGDRRRVA
jgi:hypothetical protein